jgi:hypothetical protein
VVQGVGGGDLSVVMGFNGALPFFMVSPGIFTFASQAVSGAFRGDGWDGHGLKRGGRFPIFETGLSCSWRCMGEESGRHVDSRILCVNLCVKKDLKLAKTWKIYKNVIIIYPLISII